MNKDFIKNLIDEKLLNTNNPFITNIKNQFGINDLSKSQYNTINDYQTLEFNQQLQEDIYFEITDEFKKKNSESLFSFSKQLEKNLHTVVS